MDNQMTSPLRSFASHEGAARNAFPTAEPDTQDTQDTEFAVGKTAGFTVMDAKNGILVHEGQKITYEHVRHALASGKLYVLNVAAARSEETAPQDAGCAGRSRTSRT